MSDNWVTIPGVIIQGHGVASGQGETPYPRGSIAMQKPFFLERGLDLAPHRSRTAGGATLFIVD